ncbi:LysR family transcriptional regulator [Microbacterium hydrocarbonoxydans]|uniref:LysR family transcriptional regulator n=1 Tax=Microbacterium hydrocarbonoxydans TaxID=273678 RepID=UPI002040E0F4|nr:LysR family transcriptional regulator [Microbacterium hydrocarbonoxydans]MCM3780715.1 LysR family transcriptional regulator [Microbacterium hydrocarbonoxydans]
MDFSERQLRAFIAVCDEGSITRAASRLFVSQPTLSRQLTALEETTGVSLLERLPRATRPTAAGRALLDVARAVVAAHDDLDRSVRGVTGGSIGELRVGTLYSLSLGVLPALLSRWRGSHRDVEIALHEYRHQSDLVTALSAGAFDVAIGPLPPGWSGGSAPLTTEEFVVVLSHGRARRGAVDLARLRDDEWVHFAPGNGLGDVLDAACARAGFMPRVALRTEQARAAVEYALHGLGHALAPSNVVPADVTTHTLTDPIRRELHLMWRGAGDPVIRSLVAAAAR